MLEKRANAISQDLDFVAATQWKFLLQNSYSCVVILLGRTQTLFLLTRSKDDTLDSGVNPGRNFRRGNDNVVIIFACHGQQQQFSLNVKRRWFLLTITVRLPTSGSRRGNFLSGLASP